MFDVISQSEVPPVLGRWADGAAEIGVVFADGETRLSHLYQSDPCRVLFPRPTIPATIEAVMVTTSGGIVGGDRLRMEIDAGPKAVISIVTQAAEKVYRSEEHAAAITVDIHAQESTVVEWMPQEAILFNGARLRRRTTLDVATDAKVLAGESIVFGRRARGEVFAQGELHDAWRVIRDGTLIWADALHLDGDVGTTLNRSWAFNGAAAIATLVYVADDAAAHLDRTRSILETVALEGCSAGATVLGNLLLVRLIGPDAKAVRRTYGGLWARFRAAVLGAPERLPRVWEA